MGLAAKKIEPAGVSFDDMLAQAAKPKVAKAKAKSKMPELDPPEDIREQVDKYIEAKEAETKAKTAKDYASEQIIGFVKPHQDKDGYSGMFRHSYAIPGNKGSVKFVSSNRFSVSAEDEDMLVEILGDAFHELIEKKFDVMLKPEVFQDADLKAELENSLGDRFSAFFDVVSTLKVRDEFDKKIYQHVTDEKTMEVLRTFARPYKPSLR